MDDESIKICYILMARYFLRMENSSDRKAIVKSIETCTEQRCRTHYTSEVVRSVIFCQSDYYLLLRRLANNTAAEHVDYEALAQSARLAKDIATTLNHFETLGPHFLCEFNVHCKEKEELHTLFKHCLKLPVYFQSSMWAIVSDEHPKKQAMGVIFVLNEFVLLCKTKIDTKKKEKLCFWKAFKLEDFMVTCQCFDNAREDLLEESHNVFADENDTSCEVCTEIKYTPSHFKINTQSTETETHDADSSKTQLHDCKADVSISIRILNDSDRERLMQHYDDSRACLHRYLNSPQGNVLSQTGRNKNNIQVFLDNYTCRKHLNFLCDSAEPEMMLVFENSETAREFEEAVLEQQHLLFKKRQSVEFFTSLLDE